MWSNSICRFVYISSFAAASFAFDRKKTGCFSAQASTKTSYSEVVKQASNKVKIFMETTGCPGLSVCVSVAGRIVYSEGMGFADVENMVPCSPNSVYRIGSIRDCFASLLLGDLLARKVLQLTDNVRDIFPGIPDKYIDGELVNVTIESLLRDSCSARRIGTSSYEGEVKPEFYYTTIDRILLCNVLELVYTKISASSQVVSRLSENNSETMCDQKVSKAANVNNELRSLFKRLRLGNTHLDTYQTITVGRVKQYCRQKNSCLINANNATGIISTVPDLITLANHLTGIYMGSPVSYPVIDRTTLMKLWCADPKLKLSQAWLPGCGWFLARRSGFSVFDPVKCPDRLYVSHAATAIGGTSALLLSLPCCPMSDRPHSQAHCPAVKSHTPYDVPDQAALAASAPPVCVAVLTNLQGISTIGALALQLAEHFTGYHVNMPSANLPCFIVVDSDPFQVAAAE